MVFLQPVQVKHLFDLMIDFLCFNATFSYIMATSFSGGRSRSIWREQPTTSKLLVNFITCECESSAPFFVIYKTGCEPTPYWCMIGLYELLGNPTT